MTPDRNTREGAFCAECGHSRGQHFTMPGTSMTCTATLDTRGPSTGGDNLIPCPCKGWRESDGTSQVTPEKIGDRVVCPSGLKGVVVAAHPEIRGAVLVQPDTPDMAWYMKEELVKDAD